MKWAVLNPPTWNHRRGVPIFPFLGYAGVSQIKEQDTAGNAEKAEAKETGPGFPLLREEGSDVELEEDEIQESGQRVSFSSCHLMTVIFSLGVLVLSIIFYAVRDHMAATDASCQRRMWSYSERPLKIHET